MAFFDTSTATAFLETTIFPEEDFVATLMISSLAAGLVVVLVLVDFFGRLGNGITFLGVVAFTDFTLFSILFVVTGFFALAVFALAISLTGVLLFALGAGFVIGLITLLVIGLAASFFTGEATGLMAALVTVFVTVLVTGLVAALVAGLVAALVAGLASVLATGLVIDFGADFGATFVRAFTGTFATDIFGLTLVSIFFNGFFSATFLGAEFLVNTFLDGVFLTGIVFGIFALDVKN